MDCTSQLGDGAMSTDEYSRLQQILFGPQDQVPYVAELPWGSKQIEDDQGYGITFGDFEWQKGNTGVCNGSATNEEIIQSPVCHRPGQVGQVPMIPMAIVPVLRPVIGQGLVGPRLVPQAVIPRPGMLPPGIPVTMVPPQMSQVPPPHMVQQDGAQDHQNTDTHKHGGKPYERRNKKKRPPGYYEKMQQQETDPVPSGAYVIQQPEQEEQNNPAHSVSNLLPTTGIPLVNQLPSNVQKVQADIQSLQINNSVADTELRTREQPDIVLNQTFEQVSSTPSSSQKTSHIQKPDTVNIDCVPSPPPADKGSTDNSGSPPKEVQPCVNGASLDSPASSDISASEIAAPAVDKNSTPVLPPKPKSWAGLFRNVPNAGVTYDNSQRPPSPSGFPKLGAELNAKESYAPEGKKPKEVVPAKEDQLAKSIGEIVSSTKVCHRSAPVQPRGLINRANWCYINATLQALLACPPFYHFLKTLATELPSYKPAERNITSTPVTDSLVQFMQEFTPMQYKPSQRGPKQQDLKPGAPFEPTYVYDMLQVIQYDTTFKHGRQEDAEEFLSCILNCMHEEMLAAAKLVAPESIPGQGNNKVAENNMKESDLAVSGTAVIEGSEMTGDEDAENWERVGPKNKSVITRSASFMQSPISSIFCGQIRSVLQQAGSRESATLQPFFTLQLDIQTEKVYTLKDALEAYVTREAIQGYTSAATKTEVEASRRITLEELPPILILHLKCFVYDKTGGCQKVIKKIDYTVDLSVSKELLSPSVRGRYHAGQKMYKLFAVVNHYGEKAVGGHYGTDVYHPGINGWIRTDDGLVKTIPLAQVLKFSPPKVPYLLYYRRCDFI